MKYATLGRSALKVSKLCLGTMNFGPRTPRQDAFEILSRAVDAGVNFVDTANQYGGKLGVGTTERLLGQWLGEDKTRRDHLVIATKVYEPMSEDINDRGLSARHIQQACDASLQRLGVDHIDLYQMHHFDRAAPIEEIWQAMDRLIEQGKITYVGSSNFPGWAIARASEKAIQRVRLGLIAEQSLYNLLERRVELEVLPACRAYGLGFIPWSPLAGGLLAGTQNSNGHHGRRQQDDVQSAMQARERQLNDFQALCADLGHPPSSVAQAWLLHQPGVCASIIGPGSVDQLNSVLDVPNLCLTGETLKCLDNIFPPCGEAPEAYAW